VPLARSVSLLAALALGTPAMAFELSSSAFAPGKTIPARHTCDGADVSPPLAWTEPPSGTLSLALVCEDPDAPAGTWIHWVLYGLPAGARALPEGVPATATLADGSRQGTNDFRRTGYGGPCPPRGKPHRYFFRLYALDAKLEMRPGATAAALRKQLTGHVRGEAELMGTYGRP
jgi:Raf kinase inhibitor-like YbhB/YbcL family protein